MTPESNEEQVLQDLAENDQQKVVDWLESLDESERGRLMAELADVDWSRFRQFRRMVLTASTEATFSDLRPAPIERLPLRPEQVRRETKVIERGAAALRANRVAALVVAGGQGTRLRYDHAKGMYPISPIRGKSLFELFAEQIGAARRKYDCGLPWLVMTSPTNHEETQQFFRDNDHFGLGEDTVHFFQQNTNPILDHGGNLVLKDRDELLVGPGGHGGTFQALAGSGMVDMLRDDGRDLISYFQVDNPLVTVADPRFIGHHLAADADFSCKVIPKRDPGEGLGIAVLQDGHPLIVEYSDVPEEIASERGPNGRLRFLYGSIAIHIIDVPFVERVARQDVLRWHVAHKQYEYFDLDEAKQVYPPEKNCYKFERFIFDALRFADACAFVEVQREKEFAPVKNAEGEDSPRTARELMQRLWLQWLKQAGADVDIPREIDEPMIEISPLVATGPDELSGKVDEGWEPEFPVVLEE